MGEALLAPESNIKNLEGVVALKVLTNNLLAIVYTNGLLRVIQLGDLSITTETNLLGDKGRLAQLGSGRVVEAQIAFKTHLAVPDITQSSLSKSISLGVTMAVESSRTAQKTHTLHTFSLRYDDFRVSMDG